MVLDRGPMPTAAEINALPDHLRSYIHDLEVNLDPAGEVRRCRLAEDENRMLRAKLAELVRDNDAARLVMEALEVDLNLDATGLQAGTDFSRNQDAVSAFMLLYGRRD